MASRPTDDVLWIVGDAERQDRAHITRVDDVRAVRRSSVVRSCAGRRVVLALERSGDVATALCALDGTASALLLLPRELTSENCRELIDRFEGDLILVGGVRTRQFDTQGLCPRVVAVEGWSTGEEPLGEEGAESTARADSDETLETEWVLATSGTTATPRLVSHSLRSLTRTTREARDDKATEPSRDQVADEPFRWGLLYEIERFAGLQVLLQAIWARNVLLIPPSTTPSEPVLRFLAEHGCTAISCTPSWARRLLLSPVGRAFELRHVTLGGEIADAAILTGLASAFPSSRLVHIYASTEAGVGFTVRDGKAGFPASYLDEEIDGVQLEIRDGRLWLRPPLTGQAYIDGGGERDRHNEPSRRLVADERGWIDSGDLVRVDGDRVSFLGRAIGAINVGGSKVLPEEVEAVILQVEGVHDCLVRGHRSGLTGQLVEALIVAADERGDGEPKDPEGPGVVSRVRRHCSAHLPRFKRPALVRLVDGVELAAAGKKSRRVKNDGTKTGLSTRVATAGADAGASE